MIYEPKVKYHVGEKKPPRISDSLFGWLPPLHNTREPELVQKLGLDAATFLRFGRMFRYMFSIIAFLACAILIPVDLTYNLANVSAADRDVLSMLTIRDVQGPTLFAHVAMSYVITATVMYFVWKNWSIMLTLRREWFRSPEYVESFYARTLAFTHVPKSYQSDEGLRAIFDSVKVPYPTTSVHIGRRVGRLPELIEYHNTAVRELEQVLVTYLKGGHIAKERPTIRIGGWCGIGGVKKDAIDFYTAKLKRTEQAITDYRAHIDTRKAENYGFASMASVPYAHIVASILRRKHPKGTTIVLAPNPKDIIWQNLPFSPMDIFRKKTLGFLLLVLVCFFNTIPLFVISILANLASIASFVPFIKEWSQSSRGTFAVASGVLPPAVSALFAFFLPIMMRWLSRYQGSLTHSRLDRAVVARYFAFLVISQLVIFTLIGVGFNSVQEIVAEIGEHHSFQDIIQNLHTLPNTINRTYINQASYWLTFFPLRGFLVIFDLAQILNLVWTSFKTRVFGRTPRDIREWTQPPEFEYAVYYSNILFMGTVALVFAPLAPLVVLAGAIVFWLGSFVYKYQLMFVCITRVETGGRMWNTVVNRLLVSVVLMQLLMILTIGLQYGFRSFMWLTTVPPILFIILFKIYIDTAFYSKYLIHVPSEEELRRATIHSSRADASGNRLEKRFGHPALHADLFTPMLHAKMMPLLADVYKGKIGTEEAKLDEYGGRNMESQVIEGGIRIAAIEQRDLEYDPVLYQRDRGELDWDQRSMSMNMLGPGSDTTSIYAAKSNYHAYGNNGRGSPAPSAYNQYLAKGHMPSRSDIELDRLDSVDQVPLLTEQQPGGFYPQQPHQPVPRYSSPAPMSPRPSSITTSPLAQYPPQPRTFRNPAEGYREAPLHRPYPPSQSSRQNTSYQEDVLPPNMAGRGVYRY